MPLSLNARLFGLRRHSGDGALVESNQSKSKAVSRCACHPHSKNLTPPLALASEDTNTRTKSEFRRFLLKHSRDSFPAMVVEEIVNRRSSMFLLWLTIAVAGVILFVLEPGKSALLPACPFRALTGFSCPGCGTTRGLHQLLHGNLAAAFQLNPFMILSLPFLLYALMNYTNTVLRGKPMRRNTLPAKYIWALFGLVLFFWVFRNTPFYPFVS